MANGTIPLDAYSYSQEKPQRFSISDGHTATFNIPSSSQYFVVNPTERDILVMRTASGGNVFADWMRTTHERITTSANTLVLVNSVGTSYQLYFYTLYGSPVTLTSDVVTPT